MFMSDEEIKYWWRHAEDPENNIQVLADLNGVRETSMYNYLEKRGYVKPRPKIKKMKLSDLKPEMLDKMRHLYEQGKQDKDICEATGVTDTVVKKWRRHNGLPANLKKWEPPAPRYLLRGLYYKGLNDREIGLCVGASPARIARWRNFEMLPPNRTKEMLMKTFKDLYPIKEQVEAEYRATEREG